MIIKFGDNILAMLAFQVLLFIHKFSTEAANQDSSENNCFLRVPEFIEKKI